MHALRAQLLGLLPDDNVSGVDVGSRCPRRSANRGSSRVAGGGSRGSVARGGEGSSSVPGVRMRRQLSGVEEEPEAEVGEEEH